MKATLAAILGASLVGLPLTLVYAQSATPPQSTQMQPAPDKPQSSQQTQGQAPAQPGCQQSKDTCELLPEPSQPKPQTNAPAPQKTAPAKPASKEKPLAGKKKKTAQPADGAQASGPKRIVVREGGTSEPVSQLTPGMSEEQASHSRQTTTELLSTTEANLKRASGRQLNQGEQATVDQIRKFMEQANAAVKAGDFQRGHNLAMKAHLLSDDLVRH